LPAPPGTTAPAPGAAKDEPAAETRDVGALFEQLRSEQQGPEPAPATGDAGADAAAEATDAPAAGRSEPAEPPVTEPPEASAEAEPEAEVEPEPEEPEEPSGAALVRARDDALAKVTQDLSRRATRALQDEQNDVLDGLRRQRGKIDTAKILPAADEQVARWAHVLQPAVDRAYAAGAEAAGDGDTTSAPGGLLTELSKGTVGPLRIRLEDSLGSIDGRSPADTELAVAQALGARYREWRTQNLDTALGDALAAAYARGVYDRAPDGARLRWVAAREGRCPDCDDNALEPTLRGSEFPTGQAFPPAHPGCRCLLVVETRTS
jgi:hypothetical protein